MTLHTLGPIVHMSLVPEVVRALTQPAHPRFAAFDADGVLWAEDIFEDFTRALIASGRLESGGWPPYEALTARDPYAACFAILHFYRGMRRSELGELAERYWCEGPRRHWHGPVCAALHWLKHQGYRVVVVSATPSLLLEPLYELLPVDDILGLDLAVDADDTITGAVAGIASVGAGKAQRLRVAWPGRVHVAVGNSAIDIPMLELAQHLAWAFKPDTILTHTARRRGWLVTR